MPRLSPKDLTSEIIQIMKQKARKDYGQSFIRRSAHTATLATLKGYLKVEAYLPQELKVGIFKTPQVYPVWIRISNSSNKVKNDAKKDVRGLAIQLQVEDKLQDFILVSTKYMPLCDLEGFHAILSMLRGIHPIKSAITLLAHLHLPSAIKLLLTLKHEPSPLDIPYFSITPYHCGNEVVKYTLIPANGYKSKRPVRLTPTYLRENMKRHLTSHSATFNLMVQVQKKGMSIEDASDLWDESVSPLIKVGEIKIKPQQFDRPSRRRLGEALTFSPGHSLKAHAPVGELNAARITIYKQMQKFRKRKRRK